LTQKKPISTWQSEGNQSQPNYNKLNNLDSNCYHYHYPINHIHTYYTVAHASTSYQHIKNLTNILQRGPGGYRTPRGSGGGDQPQGPPAGPPGDKAAEQNLPAVQDAKLMGNLLPIFDRNRKHAEDFIKLMKRYLSLNANVVGFNSYTKKAAFTLTLLQGPDVAG
jgi:hypothetical protein